MSAVRGLINAAEVGSDGEIRLPDEIRLPTCSVRTVVSGIQKKVFKVLDPTKKVREVRNWTKDETKLFCNVPYSRKLKIQEINANFENSR